MRQIAVVALTISWLSAGCGGWGSGSQAPAVVVGSPEQDAARVFALALSLEKEGETKKAFAAYHQIVRNFPETPAGKKAAERIRKAQGEAMRKPRSKKKS
jgi:TolA-binding protein